MHRERYVAWTNLYFTTSRLRCVAYQLGVQLQLAGRNPFKEWCDLYKHWVAIMPQGEFEGLVTTLQGMPGRKRVHRRKSSLATPCNLREKFSEGWDEPEGETERPRGVVAARPEEQSAAALQLEEQRAQAEIGRASCRERV